MSTHPGDRDDSDFLGDWLAGTPSAQPRPQEEAHPEPPLSRRALREAQEREQSASTGPAAPLPQAPQSAFPEECSRIDTPAVPAVRAPGQAPDALGDLFASPPAAAPPRRRRTGCLIAFLVVLVLLGAVAGAGIWAWNSYGDRISEALGWGEPKDYEPGLAHGETLVVIDEGDTGIDVSRALWEAGVTKTEEVFYDYLVTEALAVTFYPGLYRLPLQMTAEAALDGLRDTANRLENSVLLREGLTVAQSLPLLAEGTGIPLADFTAAAEDPATFGVAADSLEGWLFPATYTFQPDMTATAVLQLLVDRTVQSLDSAGVPEADRQRILTIASIIQREARFEHDFYRVSRVIQNRLDDGMLLQMDSTAQYGYQELHDGSASTSSDAQLDDNAWNTYVVSGLPAGPIANPGDLAIDAAMHPDDGPWLYFVTVNLDTGETLFSVTYDEHLDGVERWRDWCTQNPDSGC